MRGVIVLLAAVLAIVAAPMASAAPSPVATPLKPGERANELIGKALNAVTVEDQWVVVQAIAYSGLPDWKGTLRRFSGRMPARQVMIEKYLTGKLKTLDEMEFDKNENLW